MTHSIDFMPYVTAPRFSWRVLGPRAAARGARRPEPAPSGCARGLARQAEALREVVRERMRTSPKNLRPLDARVDAGWVALREALDAKARLEGTPSAALAERLVSTLFPAGTGFVRAPYRER